MVCKKYRQNILGGKYENEKLLEKVKTVLKEIEDLEYNEQQAVIYVAQKTLEVNPPESFAQAVG
jgi:hypothetical protein